MTSLSAGTYNISSSQTLTPPFPNFRDLSICIGGTVKNPDSFACGWSTKRNKVRVMILPPMYRLWDMAKFRRLLRIGSGAWKDFEFSQYIQALRLTEIPTSFCTYKVFGKFLNSPLQDLEKFREERHQTWFSSFAPLSTVYGLLRARLKSLSVFQVDYLVDPCIALLLPSGVHAAKASSP